jgi:hypothetical protein
MFSLCIPTMDRFDSFLSHYLPQYLDNELISEIIITDDSGKDYDLILKHFPNHSKLQIFKNPTRLGPFLNKLNACLKASNEWIALIDSDNFADINYFSVAKKYIDEHISENEKNIILAPSKALPNFNFSYLSGLVFKKGHFQENKRIESERINNSFSNSMILMNAGNYVLNKHLINYLDLQNELPYIHLSSACDVIYLNTILFEQLDLNMHVVAGLEYSHVVHNNSIYMKTRNDHVEFNNMVYQRYGNLQ